MRFWGDRGSRPHLQPSLMICRIMEKFGSSHRFHLTFWVQTCSSTNTCSLRRLSSMKSCLDMEGANLGLKSSSETGESLRLQTSY